MNPFLSFLSLTSVADKNYIFNYTDVNGIGDDGVVRRDPSDVIKINNTYYVFYSRNSLSTEPPYGYFSTVWMAKSTDTVNWTEVGEVIPKGGVGDWDEQSTFTPNVLIVDDIIYIYYTSVDYPFSESQKTRIGIAYQNINNLDSFPYTKFGSNPILNPSETDADWDSMRIDDSELFIQNGKVYLYYKGRKIGETPNQTRHGVAISDSVLGTYTKYVGNPIYESGHEVLMFRYRNSIRSVISAQGYDPSLYNSILQSEDGLTNWNKVVDSVAPVYAGGYYRSDNTRNAYDSRNLQWGISTEDKEDGTTYLVKFVVE